jgi:hypothetical protein
MRISAGIAVASAVLIALAGCSDREATTTPSATTPAPARGGPQPAQSSSPPAAGEAAKTPTWRPSLQPRSETLYLGQGALPHPVLDQTTASKSGRLIVRAECQGGELVPVISVAGNEKRLEFECDGKRQEKFLTDVKKDQELAIQYRGDSGVQFAVELVVR